MSLSLAAGRNTEMAKNLREEKEAAGAAPAAKSRNLLQRNEQSGLLWRLLWYEQANTKVQSESN